MGGDDYYSNFNAFNGYLFYSVKYFIWILCIHNHRSCGIACTFIFMFFKFKNVFYRPPKSAHSPEPETTKNLSFRL